MEHYVEIKYKVVKERNFSCDFQQYPKLNHITNQHRLRKNLTISSTSKFNNVKLKILNKIEKTFYQKNLYKELKDPKNSEIKAEIEVLQINHYIIKCSN